MGKRDRRRDRDKRRSRSSSNSSRDGSGRRRRRRSRDRDRGHGAMEPLDPGATAGYDAYHGPYQVQVPVPQSRELRVLIDHVAYGVSRVGQPFEDAIMEAEKSNPHFAFLFASWRDPEQLYYRWRVYSLLQGDTLDKWRETPFDVDWEGTQWVPPSAAAMEPRATPQEIAIFKHLVHGATEERLTIAKVMVYALDNAVVAADLSKVLITALRDDSATTPQLLARISCMCDLVVNSFCSAPHASTYRKAFEEEVVEVFRTLKRPRPTPEETEKMGTTLKWVLDAWEQQAGFNPRVLMDLRKVVTP